jgi:hypothetical protein
LRLDNKMIKLIIIIIKIIKIKIIIYFSHIEIVVESDPEIRIKNA